MEAYVTRKEFDKVLKDLRKLQGFLRDTFGAKFLDYDEQAKKTNDVPASDRIRTRAPGTAANASVSNGNNNAKSTSSSDIIEVERQDPLKFEVGEGSSLPKDRNEASPTVIIRQTEKNSNSALKSAPGCGTADTASSRTIRIRIIAPSEQQQQQPSRVPTPPAPAPSLPRRSLSTDRENNSTAITQNELSKTTQPSSKKTTASSSTTTSNSVPAEADPDPPIAVMVNTTTVTAMPAPRVYLPSFKNNKRSLKLDGDQDSTSAPPAKKPVSSLTAPSVKPAASTSTSSPTEIIQCDQCQLFIYASELDAHIKNHDLLGDKGNAGWEKNPLFKLKSTCPVCKVACKDILEYEKHCTKNHRSAMPCPICGKCFNLFTRLKRHMFIHKNQRFTCEICGKCYNRKDNLTAHLKSHDDSEEPTIFYCGICKGAAFSSREGRDRHLRTMHQDEVEEQEDSSPTVVNTGSSETIKCEGDGAALGFEYEGDDDLGGDMES